MSESAPSGGVPTGGMRSEGAPRPPGGTSIAASGGDRQGSLRQVKLTTLVRERWEATGDAGVLPGGATLVDRAGGRGWVLVDDGAPSVLGGGLAWARRNDLSDLHVLVEGRGDGGQAAGIIARRAAAFAPAPSVWVISGRTVAPAAPAPPAPARTLGLPTGAEDLLDTLRAHGVDPVVEHGVAAGEVLGLEVARVVADGTGGVRLDVGVGRHDREARSELRPDAAAGTALDEVVAVVRQWRAPGARRHPANILARERWLRSVVLARPELAGARRLDPVPPVLPRDDLRQSTPAAAAGVDVDGEPLVVICSTGVDLDLVPTAADHRLLDGRDPRLVIVVPEGDDYPVTRELAAALRAPADVVTVPKDWPALLG